MARTRSVATPERFAGGMTLERWVAWAGTPENLAREGSMDEILSRLHERLVLGSS
jgi:hypothetical protein